jgi:hypothetical protein
MKIAQLSIFLPDSLWIIGPEEGKNDIIRPNDTT